MRVSWTNGNHVESWKILLIRSAQETSKGLILRKLNASYCLKAISDAKKSFTESWEVEFSHRMSHGKAGCLPGLERHV
jgi:hypothetical protein